MPGPTTLDRLLSRRPGQRAILAGAAGAAGVLIALGAVATRLIEADHPPVEAPALPSAEALQHPAPPAAGRRPGQPALAGPGWRVISVSSVTDVLLVIVETERLDDIVAIARDVVAPAAADHLEALVYFHRLGAAGATARVQWTPRGGYVPLTFAAE